MLKKVFLSFVTHRELLWEMGLHELKTINKGSFIGWMWLILQPLVQTAAYVVIVAFVFKTRLGGQGTPVDYALYVLSGMVPWQILTRSLSDGPMLIRSRMELVKQVIYPIETLPITSLIVGSSGAAVSFAIYFTASLAMGSLAWTTVFLPVPIVLTVGFLLGTSWILMIAGVLIKDLQSAVTIFLGFLVYLSPVVATEAIVGERMYRMIMLNPLAHMVICFRDPLMGTFHPWSWLVFALMTATALLLGGWMIARTKILINEYI
jgi:lipopolysaccharide transport system permease protein